MEKVMSKKRFGSRFIAFFVMLAMIMAMCVPVAWADEVTTTDYGNVKFKTATGEVITSIDTGDTFYIYATVMSSGTNSGDADVRIYLGDDISNIVLENFNSNNEYLGVNGLNFYLKYDDTKKEWYIDVDGVIPGEATTMKFAAHFEKKTTIDKEPLTVTVCSGTTKMEPQNANEESQRTIKANAELEWVNRKSAAPTNIAITAGGTTLEKDIVYTIIETAATNIDENGNYTAPTSTTLNNGEAVLQSYTVTDTVTLPAGMYIDAGSDANAAVQEAFALADANGNDKAYTITNITYADEAKTQISGFTLTWTEENPDTAEPAVTPMEPVTYTATLKGAQVTVTKDYVSGNVNNAIETKYYTPRYALKDGKETWEAVENETAQAAAVNSVVRTGGGLGAVSKTLTGVTGRKAANYLYNGTLPWGYVVVGDTIRYTISIENNDAIEEHTYSVEDFLGNYGLTFVSAELSNCSLTENNTEVTADESGNLKFDVAVPAAATATITIKATVANDTETNTEITNTATVTYENTEVEVSSAPVPQQKAETELSISKEAIENYVPKTVFSDGDAFDYKITVKNTGTASAENITISDVLPAGVVLNSTATKQYSKNWQIENITLTDSTSISLTETLAPGEEIYITVPVKIDLSGDNANITSIENTVVATPTEGEVLSATVSIDKANPTVEDLTISKTTSDTYAAVGETVTYTVTVSNTVNKGTLSDITVYVEDILPAGLEVQSAVLNTTTGAITNVGTAAAPVFELSNVTIPNKGHITFTVVCTVTDAIAKNTAITNTVNLKAEQSGETISSGSHTGVIVPSTTSTAITVDKTVVNSSGENVDTLTGGTTITAGEEVTFKIRIANTSGSDLTEFRLHDLMEGLFLTGYQVILVAKSSDDVIVDGYNVGDALFKGDNAGTMTTLSFERYFTDDYITADKSAFDEWWGGKYVYSGLTIPNGEWIEIGYTVDTADAWYNPFTTGTNEVYLDAGDLGIAYDKVEVAAGTDSGEDDGEDTEVTNKLSLTKTATPQAFSASISDSTTNAGTAKYTYTITLKNEGTEAYTIAEDAVFRDVLPAGLALDCEVDTNSWDDVDGNCLVKINVNGSTYSTSDIQDGRPIKKAEVNVQQDGVEESISTGKRATQAMLDGYVTYYGDDPEYGIYEYNVKTKIDADILTIGFTEDIALTAGGYLTITYTLVPSDDELSAITTEIENNGTFADREFKNDFIFNAGSDEKFKNEDDEVASKLTDTETVSLLAPKVHPGVAKSYRGHATLQSENIKYDQAGVDVRDYLLWEIDVYNAADAAGGGEDITSFTVTDTFPAGFTFAASHEKSGFVSEIIEKKIDDSTYANSLGAYAAPSITTDEKSGIDSATFNFTQYTIKPGYYLTIQILSKPKENVVNYYGMYTNEAVLTVNGKTIYDNAVVSGTKEENGDISASASVPIYEVSTNSKKYVKLKNAETYECNSESGALNNRIAVSAGDTVTYKLEVKNGQPTGEGYLEDFVIIDRLPYADDTGVIAKGDRGSVFPVRYVEGSAKVTITDSSQNVLYSGSDCLAVDYSSDATGNFESTDLDWIVNSANRAAGTRAVWTDEFVQSTDHLVRFALVNLDTLENSDKFYSSTSEKYGIPPQCTISIEFDAQVPEYVQNVGASNIAWNSFAYYFNSGDHENIVAEPAKVGVYVDGENYGGSILVRKNYSTNMPGVKRTFYFALYDAPYTEGATPIEVKSLVMTGTEDGAQATTYFTELDYISASGGNVPYYIYESDAKGVPLVGTEFEIKSVDLTDPPAGITTKIDKDTVTSDEKTWQLKYAKTTTGADGYPITMDNTDQMTFVLSKPNYSQFKSEAEILNSDYLVWHKDLSTSRTTNSAIFTNSYIATVEKAIMGPFYADVPLDENDANAEMTSTRPAAGNFIAGENGENGKIDTTVDSTKRVDSEKYAAGTTYGETNRWGGDQYHTIATGFLAQITAVGNYTIEQVEWDIKTSNPRVNSTPGVFVRLRTTTAEASVASEGTENLMYLNDFEVCEEESSGEYIETGAIGGFDDVTEDEDFLSDYTVEERAAMIAEGLGIDPDSILYDEFGQPYVIMDEELKAEAFALSETVAPVTTIEKFDKTTAGKTEYKASAAADGYAIYKLGADTTYNLKLVDNVPHITLEAGSVAYVGIIIDQLYDQGAKADIEVSDTMDSAETTMLEAMQKANMEKYTLVESPFQKNGFTMSVLYKLTAGSPITFDSFAITENTDIKADVQNPAKTMRIAATSAKKVTMRGSDSYYGWSDNSIVEEPYTNYLSLNGSGSKNYRSLVVNVDAGATLRFIARSSGGSGRYLVIEDSAGNKQKVEVPASNATGTAATDLLAAQVVTVATGGAVYIYSGGSGIDVYSVELVG